ncbi:MAG: TetR family transcriptional regulator [Gammaproteobacteria bacterium]|nr:TetR family transcriptional regulator [Gammaproteobacteria bacterium]
MEERQTRAGAGTRQTKRTRGRPRLYDTEQAIRAAGAVFWEKGFSGTSLDDLSAAMEMNRPSIYRAFGDKEEIYRRALNQFGTIMDEAFRDSFNSGKDIRENLKRFYRKALEVYSSDESALGCMLWSTAPASTLIHPEVKADLLAAIKHVDKGILKSLEQAWDRSQLPGDTDMKTLGKLLQALLHSISIRVRAGESITSIRKFADSAVDLLLGPA